MSVKVKRNVKLTSDKSKRRIHMLPILPLRNGDQHVTEFRVRLCEGTCTMLDLCFTRLVIYCSILQYR